MDDFGKNIYTSPARSRFGDVYSGLNVTILNKIITNCGSSSAITSNNLDEKLKDYSLGRALISILKDKNIDIARKNITKGFFSWVIDIGENQILHISDVDHDEKGHVRYNEPEILQPLIRLYEPRF